MKKINKKTPTSTHRFTGIIIDKSEIDSDVRLELICDFCHRDLVKISDREGNNEEWFCRNCSIPFYPDEKHIRHRKVLGTQQKAKDMETLVAHTPGVNEDSVAIRHEPEIKGGLKALKDKSLKITHYEEHIPK